MQDDVQNGELEQPLMIPINNNLQQNLAAQDDAGFCRRLGCVAYTVIAFIGAGSSALGLYNLTQNDQGNGKFFLGFGISLQLSLIRCRVREPFHKSVVTKALLLSGLFTVASLVNVNLRGESLVHTPDIPSFFKK